MLPVTSWTSVISRASTALVQRSGRRAATLFVGVHIEANCGRIAVCGEAIALGVAATNGDTDISQIVAVTESGDIVPPCGMCRELISDYASDAHVILEINGVVRCVPVLELLPEKYDKSKYPNRRENQDG